MNHATTPIILLVICCTAQMARGIDYDFDNGLQGWTFETVRGPTISWGVTSSGGGYSLGPQIPPDFIQGLNGQAEPDLQYDTYATSPLLRFTDVSSAKITFDLSILYPGDGDSHAADGVQVFLVQKFGGGENTDLIWNFNSSFETPDLPPGPPVTPDIDPESIDPSFLYEVRFRVYDFDVAITIPTVASQFVSIVGAKQALVGDSNGDNVVNGLDIAMIASRWLQTGPSVQGDTNLDGVVNGLDIAQVASHWLSHSPGASSAAAVPEPTSAILAALGMLTIALARVKRFASYNCRQLAQFPFDASSAGALLR